MYFCALSARSWAAVWMVVPGWCFSTSATPSGELTMQTSVGFVAPCCFTTERALAALPPVASIGSITKTRLPAQGLPYLKDFMAFFRPGDIVKFQSIDRTAYDAALDQVAAGTFDLRIRPVKFSLKQFLTDPAACNRSLLEVLHGN